MADENPAIGAEALAEETKVNPNESASADTEQVGETTDQQGTENDVDGEHKKRLGGWQRQTIKAKREAEQARQAEAYWRNIALGNSANESQAKTETEPVKPNPDDFQTTAEYLDARDAYRDQLWERKLASELLSREQKAVEKSKTLTTEEQWTKNLTETKAKFADFDDVLRQNEPFISDAMVPVVKRAGAEILYYLGQHPEESLAISDMDQIDMISAIADIKARLKTQQSTAATEAEDEKPEPAASKAPPPITPIKRMSDTRQKTVYDDDLPFAEFVKLRNAKKTR